MIVEHIFLTLLYLLPTEKCKDEWARQVRPIKEQRGSVPVGMIASFPQRVLLQAVSSAPVTSEDFTEFGVPFPEGLSVKDCYDVYASQLQVPAKPLHKSKWAPVRDKSGSGRKRDDL